MKKIVSGFVAGAITFGSLGAYAATSINVDMKPLKYFFDGVEKKSSSQGFAYNGTTYVPLRFMAESLGKEVEWDGKNNTIYVGKKPVGATGTIYLTDLTTSGTNLVGNPVNKGSKFEMHGVKYDASKVLQSEAAKAESKTSYYLYKSYSRLTGVVGMDDGTQKDENKSSFYIYADGKLVFEKEDLIKGKEPAKVDIDLKGVNKIDIVFKPDTSSNYSYYVNFANIKLEK